MSFDPPFDIEPAALTLHSWQSDAPCRWFARLGRLGKHHDIRRLDTSGGAAPCTSCNVGQIALIP